MTYSNRFKYKDRQSELQRFGIECKCICCEEQLYEMTKGKKKPNGKSKELKTKKLELEYIEKGGYLS